MAYKGAGLTVLEESFATDNDIDGRSYILNAVFIFFNPIIKLEEKLKGSSLKSSFKIESRDERILTDTENSKYELRTGISSPSEATINSSNKNELTKSIHTVTQIFSNIKIPTNDYDTAQSLEIQPSDQFDSNFTDGNLVDHKPAKEIMDKLDLAVPIKILNNLSGSSSPLLSATTPPTRVIRSNSSRRNLVSDSFGASESDVESRPSVKRVSFLNDSDLLNMDHGVNGNIQSNRPTRKSISKSFSASSSTSKSYQFVANRVKEMMENASVRGSFLVESELDKMRQIEMTQLMKAATAMALEAASMESESESESAKGPAKGFGFRSIRAGLQKTDVKPHRKRSLERDNIVNKISEIVTSSNVDSAMIAAAASSAANAVVESTVNIRRNSIAKAQEEMHDIVAGIQRSISIIVESGRTSPLLKAMSPTSRRHRRSPSSRSHSPKVSRLPEGGHSRGSSPAAQPAAVRTESPTVVPPSNHLDTGTPSASQISAAIAAAVAAATAATTEEEVKPTEFDSPNVPKVFNSEFFKSICSEQFVESSGYKWANAIPHVKSHKKSKDHDHNHHNHHQHDHSDEFGKTKKEDFHPSHTATSAETPMRTTGSAAKKNVITLDVLEQFTKKKGSLIEAGHFKKLIRKEIQVNNSIADMRSPSEKPHYDRIRYIESESEHESENANMFSTTVINSNVSNLLQSRNPNKAKKANLSKFKILRSMKDPPEPQAGKGGGDLDRSSSDLLGPPGSHFAKSAHGFEERITVNAIMSPFRSGRRMVSIHFSLNMTILLQ